jgi:hypothetical protein
VRTAAGASVGGGEIARRTLSRASLRDLATAGVVFAWITTVLVLDATGSLGRQHVLGLLTWALLVGLLAREPRLVRVQVAVVVVFATAIEYTFSPLLEVYVYRFHNVATYVPPGHGLVYLCALALGRAPALQAWRRPLVLLTLIGGGAWAVYGLAFAARPDTLGMFWFCCLAGFLVFGRAPLLYVGAFVIVTYLELLGTSLGTWTWQTHDPTGWVSIGNPPSGAPGGYGWFDLVATLTAPSLLARWDGFAERMRHVLARSELDVEIDAELSGE